MKITQLDHVALHVRDLEQSCQFYREVLQLAEISRPLFDFPGAWFRLGAQQELHLIAARQGPVQSHHRGTHFALQVDDVEAWESHLKDASVEYMPPRRRPDGAVQVFLIDPDGYWIELCCPTESATS